MRYLFIITIILFIGCGNNSSTNNDNNITKPNSPIVKDSSNIPPSIPNI